MKRQFAALALLMVSIALAAGAFHYSKSAQAKEKAAAGLYASIAAMSVDQAKERYIKLTPTERREVWRQKWLSLDFGEFNQDQVAFIALALNELKNLQFDGHDESNVTKPLYDEAVRLFGQENARAIFGTLGGGFTIQKVKLTLAASYSCSCNIEGSFCPAGYICTDLGGCYVSTFGCGYGWVNSCNGRCRHP